MYYHLKQFIRDFYVNYLSIIIRLISMRDKEKINPELYKEAFTHFCIVVCIIEEYTIEATVEQRLI